MWECLNGKEMRECLNAGMHEWEERMKSCNKYFFSAKLTDKSGGGSLIKSVNLWQESNINQIISNRKF
jgi:hypothetical protein